jgi:hypothetical protein
VINRTFSEFWLHYEHLPVAIRAQAKKAFERFRHNPCLPSFRFKPLKGHTNVWSVRVGLHYRAVALRTGDTLRWFWIGSHAEFDREFS